MKVANSFRISRFISSNEAPFAAGFACSIRTSGVFNTFTCGLSSARARRLIRLRSDAFAATFFDTVTLAFVCSPGATDTVKNSLCSRRAPLRRGASLRVRRVLLGIMPKGELGPCGGGAGAALSLKCSSSACGSRAYGRACASSAGTFVSLRHSNAIYRKFNHEANFATLSPSYPQLVNSWG